MKRFCCAVLMTLIFLSSFACAQEKPDAADKRTQEGKLYSQMTEDEKDHFVAVKSNEILSLFGRMPGDEIGQFGLDAIRRKVDFYVARTKRPTPDSCRSNDIWGNRDLISVLRRGNRYASLIAQEFSAQELPPQLGIYLAMVESEFCPASQSPTGPIGLFRFTAAGGRKYGLKTVMGATPAKPDDRFEPRLAARAAAKYMRKMIDEDFSSDAVGIPLAVAAYSRSEDALKKYINDAAATSKTPPISFWVLYDLHANKPTATDDDDDEQDSLWFASDFRVAMFFAAWIVGENPRTFGADLPPLSQPKN